MCMEEFTMHNFFKQWKAILPLTIILTFIGLMAGILYSTSRVQSYSVTHELIVVNTIETILPEDYVAIANSKTSVGDVAKKNAGVDDSCKYKAAKSGNVVKITSTCESSAEDSRKLTESVTEQFATALSTIYEEDEMTVKTISRNEAEEQVTVLNRVLYVVIAALAGIAVSAFIAFVKLDHLSSKKHKKAKE